MDKVSKAKSCTFFKLIFLISLLYYIFWLGISIYYSITGISSEYEVAHIESLCNHIHTMYYGMNAFGVVMGRGFIYTIFYVWFIPLYQTLYIIGRTIIYFKKKFLKKKAVE